MKKKNKTKLIFLLWTLIIGIFILFILLFKMAEYNNNENSTGKSKYMTENNYSVENPRIENTNAEDANTEESTSTQKPVSPKELVPTKEPDSKKQTLTPETSFYQTELSDEIKEKITGVSYHENDNITYDDLRYLQVLYVDFNGETQQGELICNKAIADDLLEIFRALYDASYQIDKIRLIDEYGGDDDLSCADNNTSSFNYRLVEGTDHLSKHALGLAIDINPFQNPYITYPNGVERISPAGSDPYADRDSGLDHMILEGDLCYNLFIEHGFTWGGHWTTLKDYQHFQKTLE